MKRAILFVLMISFVVFTVSSGEAFSVAGSPVATQFPDDMRVFNTADLVSMFGAACNVDTAVIFFNNTDDSALGVVVDIQGDPDPLCTGWAFIAADFRTGQLWISNDGANWSPI